MNNSEELLKELETYSQNYLDNLHMEQANCRKYINGRCLFCLHYSNVELNGNLIHICDDNWSSLKVGKHPFYHETLDVCIENNGFTNLHIDK